MYDSLTGRYTFTCPARGDVRVALSGLRSLERLPGPSHPAVFAIVFACECGGEHRGLLTHDELDWAPLGAEMPFLNLMTARLEPASYELLDLAARRIQAGQWPWSFFCYPEERPRPTFPSAFRVLVPAEETVGVAVVCQSCSRTSVNLVSREHVDVPFYNDRRIAVVEHFFSGGAELRWDAADARPRRLAA
jgi:hypothetical protein